ncbi:hypothetical protein ACFY7C_22375 [Streptomyces sp. NPDC012769]|uniref:hypothetical protein n=1 Tax=Streptomyces sp. NPDC012769 TaxID=3364848 RepID=UPI0036909F6F
MRGPAAPTSPGPWDSRSEALLRTPALAPAGAVTSDGPAAPAEAIRQAASAPHRPAAAPASPQPRPADGPAHPADGPAPAPAVLTARTRRGPADPVKALMHRHRDLCERAVDPLEIAAGLEAHGVTDRTAARFRHRDVFSLAEELYARVPRGATTPTPTGPEPAADTRRAAWALAACAPGAVAVLATAGLALTTGTLRLAAGALAVLGLVAALLLAVRRGPLRTTVRGTAAAPLSTLWLLAYAAAGDGLLDQLLTGGPDTGPVLVTVLDGPAEGRWAFATGPLLALALSVAPAAWCAHLFTSGARRRLAASRGLDDFAAGTRPLLLGAVALHLAALAGLLALTGFHPGALALGGLLLIARLLAAHGLPEAAFGVLAAACAGEALVLAAVLAARLPGCDALATPVRALVDLAGPAAVPTLVCGGAALALLVHATGALSRASAHAGTRPHV